MKQFRWHLRITIFFFLVSLTSIAKAQKPIPSSELFHSDSIDISLITCGPGKQVYSLYGHTAIRFNNKKTNEDLVINYGMFSFRQKYFIPRFVFGLTDYEMGIVPFSTFVAEYLYEGRWVKEQILDISYEDKLAIEKALRQNYLPENRVYRYNYFYDNCTTRARDILLSNLSETIIFPKDKYIRTSYRKEIHRWNENHLWARWGNDLLLGLKADVSIGFQEKHFLPDQLRQDFDKTYLIGKDGYKHKLIKETHWLISPQDTNSILQTNATSSVFDNPLHIIIALSIFFLIISIIEIIRHKYTVLGKICDNLTWLICGLAGLILTAMIFSRHPTVSLNLQILILNPLILGLLVPSLQRKRNFIILLLLCLILGVAGSFIQDYASGITLLALILTVRITLLIKRNHIIKSF